ncbi:prepilin peptidase [Mesorhizobium sp. CAU 1741]|uniref:prepilin peptidase n=1 Tax=Mesorhizobium sp. CAU 1741 TaxID=3140366 RepID=UPI00325BEEBF
MQHLGLIGSCGAIVLGALAIFLVPGNSAFCLAVILGGLAAWIVVSDLRSWTIPDGAVVALGLLGILLRIPLQAAPLMMVDASLALVLDFVLCGGALLLLREYYFRTRGADGIGLGDVKLAGAAALLLGTFGFAWALLLASVLGLLVVVVVRAMKPNMRFDRIPFGALLAPASWLMWLQQVYFLDGSGQIG